MPKSNTALQKIWLEAAVLVALVAVGWLIVNNLQQNYISDQPTDNQAQSATVSSDDRVKFTATDEGSALDQLLKINQSVVTIESDMGVYIDSINGLAGGTDGKYWSFYVDGEMAMVGAADYQPKSGEVIEWVFQKI